MNTIFARQYGIEPNTRVNSAPILQTLIDSLQDGTRIELEPGRYDFFPTDCSEYSISLSNTDPLPIRHAALLFRGRHDIELCGNGAEFILHGHLSAVVLQDCQYFTLRDISFDWDIPLSAEGTIIRSDTEFFDVKIDPVQFPHHVSDGRLFFDGESWSDPLHSVVEFDGVSLRVPPLCGDTLGIRCAQQQDGCVRLFYSRRFPPHVGDYIVLRHSERSHPLIVVHHSSTVTINSIQIYSTAGLGILSQFSKDLNYRNISIRANTKKGRKVLSGHVDGLHCSNLRGSLTVEDCYFHGLMDDPINVHGTSTVVERRLDESTLLCRFGHKYSKAFPYWAYPGDNLTLSDPKTMSVYATALVREYKLLDEFHFKLSFATPLPEVVQDGHVLENISAAPSVSVRRCFFGSCRARGMLLSTPKPSVIEENVFESSGSAMLLAGDANYWYESGSCHDVLIRRNIFNRCLTAVYQYGGGVISLWPYIPEQDHALPYHTNIHVEDNTFLLESEKPAFYAHCCSQISFCGNKLFRTNLTAFGTPACETHNCSDVIVDNNMDPINGYSVAVREKTEKRGSSGY